MAGVGELLISGLKVRVFMNQSETRDERVLQWFCPVSYLPTRHNSE